MPGIPSLDLYAILGVSQQATKEEIKSAYRVLSSELHSDKHDNDDLAKMFADRDFIQLKEAFDTLNDDIDRILYEATYPQGFSTPLERAQAERWRRQWVRNAGTKLREAYILRLQLFQCKFRHQIVSREYQEATDEETGAKWNEQYPRELTRISAKIDRIQEDLNDAIAAFKEHLEQGDFLGRLRVRRIEKHYFKANMQHSEQAVSDKERRLAQERTVKRGRQAQAHHEKVRRADREAQNAENDERQQVYHKIHNATAGQSHVATEMPHKPEVGLSSDWSTKSNGNEEPVGLPPSTRTWEPIAQSSNNTAPFSTATPVLSPLQSSNTHHASNDKQEDTPYQGNLCAHWWLSQEGSSQCALCLRLCDDVYWCCLFCDAKVCEECKSSYFDQGSRT